MFETTSLPVDVDAVAPDGSNVRLLLAVTGGGLAHFELPPGGVSIAVHHRTVEEIWYFLSGRGEMWRRAGDVARTVAVAAGVCVTIPLGTEFQFRSHGPDPLIAVGVTMPPWPGAGEAIRTAGAWVPTLGAGPGLVEP